MLTSCSFAGQDEPFAYVPASAAKLRFSLPSTPLKSRLPLADWLSSLQQQAGIVPKETVAQAVELAEKFFGGLPRAEEVFDVESERRYIVIHVQMKGEPAEIVDWELAWHEALEQLIGADEFHFRLLIVSQR